jgi:7-carboxy-7-deazaguanine synthase
MKLYEIFESISGESGIIPQGAWCTFIRFKGCNLRCHYCDTAHTQIGGGEDTSMMEIADQIKTKYVTITGGEPLLQKDLGRLINELKKAGHIIQVETNGSFPPLRGAPCGWVMDLKGPSSGMSEQIPPLPEFIERIQGLDAVVKFIIQKGNDHDLFFACNKSMMLADYGYQGNFIFSPMDADPATIEWMMPILDSFLPLSIKSRLIISLQIHKLCKMP